MKMVRFSVQALVIILLVGAVFVIAAQQSNTYKDEERDFFFSPFFKKSVDSASKIDPRVLADFDKGLEEVKVIVNVMDRKGNTPKNDKIINRVMRGIDEEKISETFANDGFVAILTQKEAKKLSRNKNVEYIEGIKFFETSLNDVIPIIKADESWQTQINDVSLDGSGQSIVIVDTGIDFTHPDLINKNIVGNNLNCYEGPGCWEEPTDTDLRGHGTHVAGIAAASPGEGIPGGVAKGADLISAKVFQGENGGADPISIRRAIEWAIDNKDDYGISVISMSLNFPGWVAEDYCDDTEVTIRNGVNHAVAENIAVVVSTGNEGSSEGINSPACLSNVIPVGATEKDDEVWIGSNYWSFDPMLFAHGAGWELGGVLSTCSSAANNCDEGIYTNKAGTSMSAPAVAGTLAIYYQMLELAGMPMSMHPKTEIEPRIFEAGDPIVDLDFEQWRRINVRRTVVDFVSSVPCLTHMGANGTEGGGYNYYFVC